MENWQNNMRLVMYVRTYMAIIAAIIAGVMGYTALYGAFFFFTMHIIISVGIVAKMGFQIKEYFNSSMLDFLSSGMGVSPPRH